MAPQLSALAARLAAKSANSTRTEPVAPLATREALPIVEQRPPKSKKRKTNRESPFVPGLPPSTTPENTHPIGVESVAKDVIEHDLPYIQIQSDVSEDNTLKHAKDCFDSDQDSLDPPTETNEDTLLCTFSLADDSIIEESVRDLTVQIDGRDVSLQQTLAILGQYDLWIRKGAITIYGAVLHASAKLYRVYAPSTHSLPLLKAIPNPFDVQQHSTEVTIKSCGSRIRLLKNVSSKFGRIWNSAGEGNPSASLRSFKLVRNSSDDPYKRRRLSSVNLLTDWVSVLSKLSPVKDEAVRKVVMICGPKGSGKSTFGRLLSNCMITRARSQAQAKRAGDDSAKPVAFLDLDPGQPEFSPPGQISLAQLDSVILGPPFTHPMINFEEGNHIIRSHCIGALSPKDDPSHYLSCALDLFNHYTELLLKSPTCPLVINCSGWIQGEGVTILVDLIRAMHCSDVVFMSTSGPEDAIKQLSGACSVVGTAFHTLTSQSSPSNQRTAAELRAMQTLSYFHLAEPEAGELRWNTSPITTHVPLVVHYSGPQQSIFAVMVLGDMQNPRCYETVLEGCIVDIVAIEDDAAITENPPHLDADSAYTRDPEDPSDPAADNTEDMTIDSPPANNTPLHLQHPSIHRTLSSQIPYLLGPQPHHHSQQQYTAHPLSPSHTSTLGQALIRSICPHTQTFHLLTPIPSSTLHSLYKEGRKLVLVRGRLDAPTWAYEEDGEWKKVAARRRKKAADTATDAADATGEVGVEVQDATAVDVDMIEREQEQPGGGGNDSAAAAVQDESITDRSPLPWAEMVYHNDDNNNNNNNNNSSSGQRKKSSKGARKPRSGRRDLKFRSQA